MPFLSPEQIRAVRIKGSKLVAIEEIDRSLRVVRLASGAALEAEELQKAVRDGSRKRHELVLFMLEHALADEQGNMLSAQDARTLFDLLPMSVVSKLVNEVATVTNDSMPETGEVVSPGKS